MKFVLEESLRGSSDDELLADLRRSAKALGRETVTISEYEQAGKTHPSKFSDDLGHGQKHWS